MADKLRILCLDIENFPCEVYAWALGEQHVSLDFLKRDWNVCAWSAKWYGSEEIIYKDNRGKKNVFDDKELIKELVKLMNQADVIIGQNVQSFDIRKLAARAAIHKLPPFRPVKITDILTEERRVFNFTSHKLAYKTEMINEKYKKLKHEKYPGFDLWKACMEDKLDAWKEMEKYCKYDVLSTEEHYHLIRGWIRTHHMGPIDGVQRCKCGSTNLKKEGFANTDSARYQIYSCRDCGKWPRGSENLLSKEQKSARLREAA